MVEKLYCNSNPRVLGLLSCSHSWFLFSSYFAFSSFLHAYMKSPFLLILLDFALFLFYCGFSGFLRGVSSFLGVFRVFLGVFLAFLGCSWFSWSAGPLNFCGKNSRHFFSATISLRKFPSSPQTKIWLL